MQILAIDNVLDSTDPEKMKDGLLPELKHTLHLYLEDKIRSFYFRKDRPGVIFILECDSIDEAHNILQELPFVKDGFLDFNLIPIGPLEPIQLLF